MNIMITGSYCQNDFNTNSSLGSFYKNCQSYQKPKRIWKNENDKIWILDLKNRKDIDRNGIIGTYKTFENAKKALNDYSLRHFDVEASPLELQEGEIATDDQIITIIERFIE